MKFVAVSVLALAAGETDRKVPPRTPPQRLNTLQRFAKEWIDAQVKTGINRPQRALKMKSGIDRLETKMGEAFLKDCAFFDPTVLPHGGPNPNSQRKRRSAFAQKELSRIAREVVDNDSIDIFDMLEDNYQRGVGDQQIRLSDDIDLAWKQIGTGFRKWILRYISDCNGQKTYSYHTNRLAKIHGNVKLAYDTVGASQEEDYEDFEGNNYD
jgi:hypothetical protein